MSRPNLYRIIILTLAVIAFVVALIVNGQPDNRLVNTFTSAAFNFKYPDGWEYVIPEFNILVLGKPEMLINQQPGSTLTVHRDLVLSGKGGLAKSLNIYLEQGPLSTGQSWKKLNQSTDMTLGGLPALVIDLQGSERPTWPEVHSQVTVVRARNGNVYFLTISSPVNDWESNRPILESILESITITE